MRRRRDGLALLGAAAKASKRSVWETLRRVEESLPGDLSPLVRLSATDWADGGISEADVVAIAYAFALWAVGLADKGEV